MPSLIISSGALEKKAENVKPSFVIVNDLNNIVFFARIVEQGSLTAAAESLGVAKSMLSQHLSSLEKELGVQLIRRTSRRQQVTEIGKRYYAQSLVILNEIARASTIVDSVRELPRGRLRIACPLNFAQVVLAPVLTEFMLNYPEVDVALDITNRTPALTDAGHDFTLHIGSAVKSPSLVTSSFAVEREMLVASPVLLSRIGTPRKPADLKSMPSAAGQHPPDQGGRYVWRLSGPNDARQSVQHFPRLLTEDLWVIRESALAACAVAALPPVVCRDAIDEGRLVRVLPNWMLGEQKLHVTYPSRRGLTLAARTLIDFISNHLRTQLRGLQEVTIHVGTAPYRKKDRSAAHGVSSGIITR